VKAGSTSVPSAVASLAPYVRAGVFGSSEVQLAVVVERLVGPLSPEVRLAVAVAARGPRLGHVCIDLADVHRLMIVDSDEAGGLAWPTAEAWSEALENSRAVATPTDYAVEPFRPLVFDGRRIYLQRYWDYELSVAGDLRRRAAIGVGEAATATTGLMEVLDAVFGARRDDGSDRQREAVKVAMENRVSVIAGGPGTGKTRTIARLLVVAHAMSEREDGRLDVALAAPTGKAATKMTEAVNRQLETAEQEGLLPPERAAALRQREAQTLHRLLGSVPGTQFRHNRDNPLPHDLVVVDETSMVPLQLMARLLAALRPTARLVLVGDPFQLASVEAGSVLEDVVGPALFAPAAPSADAPLAGRVTVLTRMHRFAANSTISALANAVRQGDAERTIGLLGETHDDVAWIQPGDTDDLGALHREVSDGAVDVALAALTGDAVGGIAASNRLKVLAATRHGENGLYEWNDRIERAVAARIPQLNRFSPWYVGRPIIVTANDYVNHVSNGDVGLVVSDPAGARVAFENGGTIRLLSPSRLDRVETWWAMTIHKSQGSEFSHAVVSLPTGSSPILTRELLYTAVTRGKERLTVVASEAALRAAVGHPVARASGLRERLWPSGPEGDA
jgi:exodeoxyribonuclease V alpha subunit